MRRVRARRALLAAAVCALPLLAPRAVRAQGGAVGNTALADTLRRMGADDQAIRADMGRAMAERDTLYMRRLMQGDATRTRQLKAIVAAHGWPTYAMVGKEAAHAAWLVLQHSDDYTWQRTLLPQLDEAARRGEASPSDVATLTDRVLVRLGQGQRYGQSFTVQDGKLVADRIDDLPGLEARRAAKGLPPMKEYVRLLGEIYSLPVVWPPTR